MGPKKNSSLADNFTRNAEFVVAIISEHISISKRYQDRQTRRNFSAKRNPREQHRPTAFVNATIWDGTVN